MHNMAVFAPIMKSDLTTDEKKRAISSLMFLKEKRDKTVKGRFCADGRGQRGDWTRQETTSPTVSTESVFLTSVVDAHERRDVACYDIPGAFLHADSNEDITMVLKGRLAELMVQVAPNLYRKYVTVDKRNVPILYVKIQKNNASGRSSLPGAGRKQGKPVTGRTSHGVSPRSGSTSVPERPCPS